MRTSHRTALLFAFAITVPSSSSALQLTWQSGSTDIAFTETTRCSLVISSDDGPLPPEWRVVWVGEGCTVRPLAADGGAGPGGDLALACGMDAPSSATDVAANQSTAHFCSDGAPASRAMLAFEVAGGGRGKFMVVASDRQDPGMTALSNEVTFNGGVSSAFPPTVLAASVQRSGNTLTVAGRGHGLAAGAAFNVVAADASWSVPLSILTQTDSTITAQAEVPAALPPAVVQVTASGSGVGVAQLAGDEPQEPAYVSYSYGKFQSPSPTIWRPKDFTFFYDNLGKFHLFFMRTGVGASDSVEKVIAHVSGQDMHNWLPDSTELTLPVLRDTNPAIRRWDERKVWAPSLVQQGPTYYLFYTGVDDNLNETIGVATTTNINVANVNWTRSSQPLFRVTDAEFVDGLNASSPFICRDPFVWEDPHNPGHYHMWFTAALPGDRNAATIGIAKTVGADLTQWVYDGHVTIMSLAGITAKAESPHVLSHVNARGDTAYYLLATGNNAYIPGHDRLMRNGTAPWDLTSSTTAGHWNLFSSLYDQLGFAGRDSIVFGGWEASEYCKFFKHEYFAAINYSPGEDSTATIWIAMFQWIPGENGAEDTMELVDPVTDVADGTAAPVTANGVRMMGRNPCMGSAAFELALTARQDCELAVYDAQGRRVRRIAVGIMPVGRSLVSWDGRSDEGRPVGSGVYFVRLRYRTGQSVTRVVFLN